MKPLNYCLYIYIYIALNSLLNAQVEPIGCGMDSISGSGIQDPACADMLCPSTSDLWTQDNLFIPLNEYGEISVRVNIVLLYNDDGEGNFDMTDPDESSLLLDALADCNQRYSNLVDHSGDQGCSNGNNSFVSQVKIQFDWNIVQISDETYWNYDGKCIPKGDGENCCPNVWHLDPLDAQIANDPNIPKGINVYFFNSGDVWTNLTVNNICYSCDDKPINSWPKACSENPTRCDLSRSSRVGMPNYYNKYYWFFHTKNPNGDPCCEFGAQRWLLMKEIGGGLAHELGHSFFRYVNHNTSCGSSIMNPAGNSSREYLRSDDLGEMHRNMAITNLRQFIDCDQDYHTTNFRAERLVDNDEEWDLNIRMYNDVRVKTGAELKLNCQLYMPEEGKIVVERGSRLLIDGQGTDYNYDGTDEEKKIDRRLKRGLVTKAENCDEEQWWRHIEVHGNPSKLQPISNYLGQLAVDDAGVVVATNKAMVEEAVVGIMTQRTDLDWQTNKDNWGGLIKADANSIFYNNRKAIAFMKYDFPNFSSFNDCHFITDEDISHPNPPYGGISVWDTDDIIVEHCKFENYSNYGVYSIDGGMTVTSASEFSGMNIGVHFSTTQDAISAPFSITSGTLGPNVFHNLTMGVEGFSTKSLMVNQNLFNSPMTWGCYITGESDYEIINNSFTDISVGNNLQNTGFDSKHAACNSYTNVVAGIVIEGDNSGFIFDNEVFNTIFGDMFLNDGFGTPSIRTFQGGFFNPRFNKFTQNGFDNIIHQSTSSLFNYFYPDPLMFPDPSYVPKCANNGINCGLPSANFIIDFTDGDNENCLNTGDGDGQLPPPINENSASQEQRDLLALKFENNDLEGVEDFLNNYISSNEEDDAYFYIQGIRLDILLSGMEVDPVKKQSVYDIANSNLLASGYAKAILSLIDDNFFIPEEPVFIEPRNDSQYNSISDNEQDILVLPNPAHDDFLEIIVPSNQTITNIELIDMNGLLHSVPKEDNSSHNIDITNLKNGTYILRFHFESGKVILKRVIIIK